MSPGERTRIVLEQDAEVFGFVGARVYPNELPQNVKLPALVYSVVDGVPGQTMNGNPRTVLVANRVQIDVYAKDYAAAYEVGNAIRFALEEKRSQQFAAQEAGSRDLYDAVAKAYRHSIDFTVWCGR